MKIKATGNIPPKKPVIYDGDMGADDLWAIAILLAHPGKFDLLGISTVFGNVSQPKATENVQNFLHWLGQDNVPVAQGANTPCDRLRPFGDEAYGKDGVGGIKLPKVNKKADHTDIADWINDKLNASLLPVTIFCTGPATNLALLVQKYPENLNKIEKIIFMGGAISPPGKDAKPVVMENGQKRIGNITPYAEFNAYQDPKALNILLDSNAPITFMSADATQSLILTPERQKAILEIDNIYGPALNKMLMAVEHLDRTKFGVNGPFIHDPNVVLYMLAPDLYEGTTLENIHFREENPGSKKGDYRGAVTLSNKFNNNAFWLNHIKDTHKLFDIIVKSIEKTAQKAHDAIKLQL